MNKKESWALLMKLYFNCDIKGAVETAWFTELRIEVPGWKHDPVEDGEDPTKGDKAAEINTELCEVIRWVKDQDRIPRKNQGKSKDEAKGKPTIIDLHLWVLIHRNDKKRDTEFALAHSELGYRRKLIGKMKEAWEAGDLITALRITTHPEYVEGLEGTRGPSPEDTEYVISKAEEQFGYDRDEALRAWVADRKAKGLTFYGSNLLQDLAEGMNPEAAPTSEMYEEELV